jgi:hypothetical protein
VSTFYIACVREGLQLLADGPVADPAHPLHDPTIWLAEAASWVFDDSGLTEVLDSPNAEQVLGVGLRDELVNLDRAVRDAGRVVGDDPVGARALVAPRAQAVMANLEDQAPPGATRSGTPLS